MILLVKTHCNSEIDEANQNTYEKEKKTSESTTKSTLEDALVTSVVLLLRLTLISTESSAYPPWRM